MRQDRERLQRNLRWYDSLWLGNYFAAQDILRRHAPDRLDAFDDAMRTFRCPPDYSMKVQRGLFDRQWLDEARAIIAAIPKDKFEFHELSRFGRLVVHDWPAFSAMQEGLVDLVSEMAGEAVEPSYNFLSLYTHRGVCEPHLDAPSAKWTLDICIDQTEPWPIHFSQIVDWPEPGFDPGENWAEKIKADPALTFSAETLMPGDALLFSGVNQWHYRDPYAQVAGRPRCDLLFLHFVPKGTMELVKPENWAEIFAVPQLAGQVHGPGAR